MEIIGDLRTRLAGLAIGPSTLRNMVGPGGIETARTFCSDESVLNRIKKASTFAKQLDTITDELSALLPKRKLAGGGAWGPARKLLNIFLSDATYNTYLRSEYGLADIEALLEVPLDSFVARCLISDVQELKLPNRLSAWTGVGHVTSSLNAEYQAAATGVAKRLGYRCRGHLDLRYWRKSQ